MKEKIAIRVIMDIIFRCHLYTVWIALFYNFNNIKLKDYSVFEFKIHLNFIEVACFIS